MKATQADGVIFVKLSKRNLLALLGKLGREESARTIIKTTSAGRIFIIAESDEEHYAGEEAGKMHPSDERFIAAHSKDN